MIANRCQKGKIFDKPFCFLQTSEQSRSRSSSPDPIPRRNEPAAVGRSRPRQRRGPRTRGCTRRLSRGRGRGMNRVERGPNRDELAAIANRERRANVQV